MGVRPGAEDVLPVRGNPRLVLPVVRGEIGGAVRYISVFSGIEAASAAWAPLGWEPVAFSEIEPFPCAVKLSHARGCT